MLDVLPAQPVQQQRSVQIACFSEVWIKRWRVNYIHSRDVDGEDDLFPAVLIIIRVDFTFCEQLPAGSVTRLATVSREYLSSFGNRRLQLWLKIWYWRRLEPPSRIVQRYPLRIQLESLDQ